MIRKLRLNILDNSVRLAETLLTIYLQPRDAKITNCCRKLGYRYVTRKNVPFFDLTTRLGLGSNNGTFVRVT